MGLKNGGRVNANSHPPADASEAVKLGFGKGGRGLYNWRQKNAGNSSSVAL